MDFRLGVCTDCSAQFKVPASFSAAQAKCKSCGGVVNIGKVQRTQAAAPPMPAAEPPPPKKKERSGPSMKEKLLAQRREEEARQAKSKPAAKRTAAPGRKAAAAAPAKAGARKPQAAKAAPAQGKARSAGSTRTATRTAGRRNRDDGDDEESGGSRRRGARPQPKKKGVVLPLLSLLVVAGLGAGAWWFMNKDKGAPQETLAEGTEKPIDELVAEGTNDELVADAETTEGTPAEAVATDTDEVTPEEASAPKEEDPAPAADTLEKVIPEVDLSLLPDFGPVDDYTAEQFADSEKLVELFMDRDTGVAGSRAGKELLKEPRLAFPVLMNAMKKLDYTTEAGYKAGDLIQQHFEKMTNGRNFGWKYSIEPADVYFNKKVVKAWSVQWNDSQESMEYWLSFTKQDEASKKTTEESAEDAVDEINDALDELDDLP